MDNVVSMHTFVEVLRYSYVRSFNLIKNTIQPKRRQILLIWGVLAKLLNTEKNHMQSSSDLNPRLVIAILVLYR